MNHFPGAPLTVRASYQKAKGSGSKVSMSLRLQSCFDFEQLTAVAQGIAPRFITKGSAWMCWLVLGLDGFFARLRCPPPGQPIQDIIDEFMKRLILTEDVDKEKAKQIMPTIINMLLSTNNVWNRLDERKIAIESVECSDLENGSYDEGEVREHWDDLYFCLVRLHIEAARCQSQKEWCDRVRWVEINLLEDSAISSLFDTFIDKADPRCSIINAFSGSLLFTDMKMYLLSRIPGLDDIFTRLRAEFAELRKPAIWPCVSKQMRLFRKALEDVHCYILEAQSDPVLKELDGELLKDLSTTCVLRWSDVSEEESINDLCKAILSENYIGGSLSDTLVARAIQEFGEFCKQSQRENPIDLFVDEMEDCMANVELQRAIELSMAEK